ncbi:GCN5 family acetyltransferase [Rhizobium sp. Leaf384]|uniref:GNAT family N-acetyltransferase n=1 Tax=unclassified Rhizobium TaxID=2613769 RepID=UPI0007136D7C|nr:MULTISPECIES: GNAT family N-acetyltransferase [unclassified Rhizobium]KQS77945.1 GCN5 family acetyltransferase [Rhizobium sp. Leaf384]KQS83729.1 GCN5 family acetyltransferase [Rhizobium sp. Leaf383]
MLEDTTREKLPLVRRLEAIGFRAWPAATVHYDGSWLVRTTPGHGSRRLNSINPLDPHDGRDMAGRLERAARQFRDAGLVPTVRQTPLTPCALATHLDAEGWTRLSETIVMTADIPPHPASDELGHVPLRDVARFVEARIAIAGDPPESKASLTSVIEAIRAECGLFLFEEIGQGPTAVTLAVQDYDLAGLLLVAVRPDRRGEGIGRDIVGASLRWARLKGARQAWLAVEAGNGPALALYRGLGFAEAYRYVYRTPPEE